MDIQPIAEAKGVNGQIAIYEKFILINRKGTLAFLNHGFDGGKFIPYKYVTSIQFKNPGAVTSGFIQFSIMGGSEDKGGLMTAAKDENSVLFTSKDKDNFKKIFEFVLEKII